MNCKQCQSSFEHLSGDLEFYRKHDFPEPEFCPDCRHQHRIAFRNERILYRRQCDLCRKSIVTIFSGDTHFPVYCPECWWSDKWNGFSFGRDFDFSRPFFEQFFELRDQVPRQSLNNARHINSDFCNQCIGNKDSYLLFAADENQDSMYSYWINRCNDTYNSSWLTDSTLCFDVIDSENCYHCIYSQDLKNCSDCSFSYDLIGCKNCFACAGLRNKEYCIKNQSYSKEEYLGKMKDLEVGSYQFYLELKKLFSAFRLKVPHKYAHIMNSENCFGDYIINSKDCHYCFDVFDSEQCRYAFNLVHQQFDLRNVSFITEARNVYQVMSTSGENIYFGALTWFSSDAWYSDLAQYCQNVFGCVGLRHKKFCIFNKQYSESEFYDLRNRIIGHMKKTGEWGKFFPVSGSPFAYNETVAQDYFPMTKEEVLSYGWQWRDSDKKDFQPQIYPIPDHIKNTGEDICDAVLSCFNCHKNYKILPRELRFYRQVNYPVPRVCSDCRFLERLSLRNPRKLYHRKCAQCGTAVQTTYPSDRPERIYCEKCYQRAVI